MKKINVKQQYQLINYTCNEKCAITNEYIMVRVTYIKLALYV